MVCPKELRDKAEPATLLGTIWSMTFVPGLTDASQTDTDIVVLVVLLHRYIYVHGWIAAQFSVVQSLTQARS